MEDKQIIALLMTKDEAALTEITKKYNSYCLTIAHSILDDWRDCEECVADAFLKTWQSIPPNNPQILSSYIGKIVKNLALDKYRQLHASKRGGQQIEVILDELGEITSGNDSITGNEEITSAINEFLGQLPSEKRRILVLRYWHSLSIKEISEKTGLSENQISVSLNRLRSKLKQYLMKKGFKL